MKQEELQNLVAQKAIEYVREKVPYRHRGFSRKGCDCTGLLLAIMRELGYMKRYNLRKYPKDWNLHAGAGPMIIEELGLVADEIPRLQVQPGDVAVMRFGRCPAHCGIIVRDDLLMAHALVTGRVCKFALLRNSVWSGRWVTSFRLNMDKLKNYD